MANDDVFVRVMPDGSKEYTRAYYEWKQQKSFTAKHEPPVYQKTANDARERVLSSLLSNLQKRFRPGKSCSHCEIKGTSMV